MIDQERKVEHIFKEPVDAISESGYVHGFLSDDSPPTDEVMVAFCLSEDPHIYKRIESVGHNRLIRPSQGDSITIRYQLYHYDDEVDLDVMKVEDIEWKGRLGDECFVSQVPLGVQLAIGSMAEGETSLVMVNPAIPCAHSYVDNQLLNQGDLDTNLKTLPELDRELRANYNVIIGDQIRGIDIFNLYRDVPKPEISDWKARVTQLPFELKSKWKLRATQQLKHWEETRSSVEKVTSEHILTKVQLVEFKQLESMNTIEDQEVEIERLMRGSDSRSSAGGMLISFLLINSTTSSTTPESLASLLMQQDQLHSSVMNIFETTRLETPLNPFEGRFIPLQDDNLALFQDDRVADMIVYQGPQCLWELNMAHLRYTEANGPDSLPDPQVMFNIIKPGIRIGDVDYFNQKWFIIGGPFQRSHLIKFQDPQSRDDLSGSFEPRMSLVPSIHRQECAPIQEDHIDPYAHSVWRTTELPVSIHQIPSPILKHDPGTKLRVMIRMELQSGATTPTCIFQCSTGGYYGRNPPIMDYLLCGHARIQQPMKVTAFDIKTKSSRMIHFGDEFFIANGALQNIVPEGPPHIDTLRQHQGTLLDEDQLQFSLNDVSIPTIEKYYVLNRDDSLMLNFDTLDGPSIQCRVNAMFHAPSTDSQMDQILSHLASSSGTTWEHLTDVLLQSSSKTNDDCIGFDLVVLDGVGQDDMFKQNIGVGEVMPPQLVDHIDITSNGKVIAPVIGFNELPFWTQQIFVRRTVVKVLLKNKCLKLANHEITELLDFIDTVESELGSARSDNNSFISPAATNSSLTILKVPTLRDLDDLNRQDSSSCRNVDLDAAKRDKLVDWLKKLLITMRTVVRSNLVLVQKYDHGKSNHEVLKTLRHVLDSWPCHASCLHAYANQQCDLGNFAEARTVLRRFYDSASSSDLDRITVIKEQWEEKLRKEEDVHAVQAKAMYRRMFK